MVVKRLVSDTLAAMEIAALNQPYVIEKGEVDGRLVQVTIRAVEGGTLGYEEVREATRLVLDHLRNTHSNTVGERRRSHTVEERSSGQTGLIAPPRVVPESAADTLTGLVSASRRGRGSNITDEYLAWLATAYEELVPEGRGVSLTLADALDKPLQTVKGHIMRARREGFLTPALEGREGGEATEKARALVGGLRSDYREPASEIDRLKTELALAKSHAETYRKLADEFAAESEMSDHVIDQVSTET
jgi:hypothetical protein